MLTNFDFPSAVRIARVVRAVEDSVPRSRPLTFGSVVADAKKEKQFRVCTFDGEWNKGSQKTLTFRNQTATPNTVSATNLLYDIPSEGTASTARVCIISKEGTAWYFVNEERSSECDGENKDNLSTDTLTAGTNTPDSLHGLVAFADGSDKCVKWGALEKVQVVTGLRFEDGPKIVLEMRDIWALSATRPDFDVPIPISGCDEE